MLSVLIAFVVYWLILFVACYIVSEYAQNYLYDETTPGLGLKLAIGTTILAALATWLRPTYDTMFTSDVAWTVLQGIAWVFVFMLVLSFHPPHALGLGLATMVLAVGMASLAVDSLSGAGSAVARRTVREPSKPLRRPATAAPIAPAPVAGEGEVEAGRPADVVPLTP